jgi:hypothetical protein
VTNIADWMCFSWTKQMRWFWNENPYLSLAENMGTLSVFLPWISG